MTQHPNWTDHADDYEMPWSILGKITEKLYLRRHIEEETERSLQK